MSSSSSNNTYKSKRIQIKQLNTEINDLIDLSCECGYKIDRMRQNKEETKRFQELLEDFEVRDENENVELAIRNHLAQNKKEKKLA